MSVVYTGPVRAVRAEKLPKQWTVKDVERITGLTVVAIDDRKNWVTCTLANSTTFTFKKW